MQQFYRSETDNKIMRGMALLWIVLGIVAIIAAFAATLATVLLFGALLLLAGLFQFIHVFSDRGKQSGWKIMSGVLYLLVGTLLIVDPIGGAIGLTLLIALFFAFIGLLRLSFGVVARNAGVPSAWHFTGGFLNLLLAILILLGWPETGTWVIGLFVGIEMLFGGISLFFFPMTIYRVDARLQE